MSRKPSEDYTSVLRMWAWPIAAAILLVVLNRPEQISVLIYKGIIVTTAIWVGYWADRNLFGRIDHNAHADQPLHLRRAIIVAAVVLGFALGL